MLRGLNTDQLVSYHDGRVNYGGSSLYKPRPACRRISVRFTEENADEKLEVEFQGGSAEKDEFLRWATSAQKTSQTFMLTTGISSPDMKGFDEVLIANEIDNSGDIMHIYALQVSAEAPDKSSISVERFKKFQDYGVHVLDSIVRLIWPERSVTVDNRIPKTMKVVKNGNRVVNVEIHLVYICSKERCVHDDAQKLWFNTLVMLREGSKANFMVMYDPTEV